MTWQAFSLISGGMISIFTDKRSVPSVEDLKSALGKTYKLWEALETFAMYTYPATTAEWYYSGAKYGWGYRIKDKKRVILYLLPRHNFFKVALVFGKKATGAVLASDIVEDIKTVLRNAKPYAEGRGIRIEIKDGTLIHDIQTLVNIKLTNSS